jgi:tRNA-splicing ligase RtcB (3'-phosphate/5'-hydroxy nucleic acid ligase)
MHLIHIEGIKKPIFSWCSDIEEGALNQMIELAKLPFVEHCALMPDAHLGNSMPIGGVIATNGVIIPNSVGVDIGCGMGTFKTDLNVADIKSKEDILHNAIERSIPMGFSHNDDKRRNEMKQKYGEKITYASKKHLGFGAYGDPMNNVPVIVKIDAFFEQMGTLGGGNHFIELQHDEDGNIWAMVHSGSRNIGKKVCDHFNDIADKLNKKWYSQSTIPFLPADSEEGKAYIGWMNMCLQFAFYNRKAMLEEIERNLLHYFPNMNIITKDVCGEEILNIHHNYATLENHFGKNVWVHRKGATLASEKTIGIIPGSMGSASYIVKGLGNKDSLNSCSHGAGRRMGRNVFNQTYNTPEKMKEIEESMAGITHTKFGRATSRKGKDLGIKDVSEAPQAYKDISSVMENQKDLVMSFYKLTPIINWKDAGEE